MDIRANYLYMCASGNVCKMVCAQLGRPQKICAQKIVRKKFVRKWVQIEESFWFRSNFHSKIADKHAESIVKFDIN